MGQIHTKINSYELEVGLELNEAYTITPTNTGTLTPSFVKASSTVDPVYESGVAPRNGTGSWKFVASSSGGCSFTDNSSGFKSVVDDDNYSAGFFVKFNSFPSMTDFVYRLQVITPVGSGGYGFYVTTEPGSSTPLLGYGSIGNTIVPTTEVLTTGTWYFVAVIRNGSTHKYYLNGTLLATETRSSASGTNVAFGYPSTTYENSFNMSNFYMTSASIIDETAMIGIYNSTFNINYSAEVMDSNAQFNDPVSSVTPTYYAKVISKNPVFYIGNGQVPGSAVINNGSGSFGTPSLGSAVIQNASPPAPLNLINEGKSWDTTSTWNTTTANFSYTNSTAWDTLKSLFATNNFSIEFWVSTYGSQLAYGGPQIGSFFTFNGTANNYVSFVRTARTSTTETYQFTIRDNGTYYRPTVTTAASSDNAWHHFVVTCKPNATNPTTQVDLTIYRDSFPIISQTFSKPTWTTISSSTVANIAIYLPNLGAEWDEFAIYPTGLSNTEVIDNYSFVKSQSPDRQTNAAPMTGSAQMTDAVVAITVNKTISATALTATALMANPTSIPEFNINISTSPITATALMVNPSFYGNPDRTILPTPLTAEADFLSATRKNTAYSDYVKNLSPYRYHSLDNISDWIYGYPKNNTNEGSDTAYTLNMFDVGLGTHSIAQDVINNYSVHSEMDYEANNYQRSLVIKESVYNDNWGTDLPSNGTGWTMGFWMKKHESYTYNNGLIVLANINGSSTGDHIVLYYDAGRIFIELNDGGTKATYETTPVTLFNGLKHNIVMTFDRINGSSHEFKIYVDGVNKLTQNVGAIHPQIIPSTVVSSPNSTNYNIVSLGGMITTYANTLFNTIPENLNAYFDEFFWFKSTLTPTQIANQYNALPGSTAVTVTATVLTASALSVTPTVKLGAGISQIVLTGTALIVSPTLIVDFDRTIIATVLTASAEMRIGLISNDKILYVEDVMMASSNFPTPIIEVKIPGGPMIATAKMVKPYRVNGLPITNFNSYLRYLRAESLNHQISHYREVV